MLFWIVVVAAGVFLGLVGFATIEAWLPKLVMAFLFVLHVGLMLWFGLPLWSIAALDLGFAGLVWWGLSESHVERHGHVIGEANMRSLSERSIEDNLTSMGVVAIDLGVDGRLAWVKVVDHRRGEIVRVEMEYQPSSTDESVAVELLKLVREAGIDVGRAQENRRDGIT